MDKRFELLKKINHALLCISLTQCSSAGSDVSQQGAEIKKTKRLYQFHYVQRGEGLSNIARRYDMSEKDLLHINQMKSSRQVYLGQRLHVHKKNFDEFKTIPIVEGDQANEFTDLNVDKARTKESLEFAEANKETTDNIKHALLLPLVGIGALVAGAGKALSSLFNKSAEAGTGSFFGGSSSGGGGDLPLADGNGGGSDIDLPTYPATQTAKPKLPVSDNNIPDIFKSSKPATQEDTGMDLLKKGAALAVGGGVLGLGMWGVSKLLDKSNENRARIEKELSHEACVRMAMGWPLSYQDRKFTYVNPKLKEAGIFIKNTQRELFVVPAFPGKIIDIQKPNKRDDRYTVTIKHGCNNLVTVYGNLRIPFEGNVKPEDLVDVYVSRTDPIGLIDPDTDLFFAVKQIQPGKDADSVNYEFQQVAKRTARLMRDSQVQNGKIEVGGMYFEVADNGKDYYHKTLLFKKKRVTDIYQKDPLAFLPGRSLSHLHSSK
ncbi:MAG: LysM peptidoglycan-binding domain-containing protein [Alphaproteobacteria bacterium]|nr:MAG: LysM peptidoglycan-binding domain-containing protein [Alphaproteobacteria bacterium]